MNRFIASPAALGIAAAVTAMMTTGPAATAEQAAVKAFATWEASGQAVQTGADEATFVGTISGKVYVETEKGPVASGSMLCPAILRVNMDDGSQTGTGHCSFIADDGAQIFARLECSGIHLIGCDGDFTLTGGSGRFAGISGGGPVTVRSDLREVVGVSSGAVVEAVSGIMFWPNLSYQIP
jgi:hypothetical protein